MSRNNLSQRRKSAIAQKDWSHLTGKLVGYVMHVRELTVKGNYLPYAVIGMNQTAV